MLQSHVQKPVHHIGGQCQLLSRWCMCVARVAASHESIFLKDSGASIFIISSYIHPDLLRLYVLQYYLIEIKTRISVGAWCHACHHTISPLSLWSCCLVLQVVCLGALWCQGGTDSFKCLTWTKLKQHSTTQSISSESEQTLRHSPGGVA